MCLCIVNSSLNVAGYSHNHCHHQAQTVAPTEPMVESDLWLFTSDMINGEICMDKYVATKYLY